MRFYVLFLSSLIFCISCKAPPEKDNSHYNSRDETPSTYFMVQDTGKVGADILLSDKFGIPMYSFGKKVYDTLNDLMYISGYLHFQYPDKISRKVGNYVYNFKEGIIVNSYADSRKSERRVEDGDSEKTYVNGVGRDFGVRLYSEYDFNEGEINRLAQFHIDTSNQSVKFWVEENRSINSSIELRKQNVLIKKGVPFYETTIAAAIDSNLPSGALFKVSNGNGTAQIHIKE